MDCVLLKDTILVFVVGLGPTISFQTCQRPVFLNTWIMDFIFNEWHNVLCLGIENSASWENVEEITKLESINPLKPNEPCRCRTALLTYKVAFYIFIQQI